MKKLIFLVIIAIVLVGLWLFRGNIVNTEIQKSTKVLGEEIFDKKNGQEIRIEDRIYRTYWEIIENIEVLYLLPNFSKRITSKETVDKEDCELLVNGGFYDENSKPIGLFISERERISDYQKNSLFNGIVSVNLFAIPRISRETPKDDLVFALQTGPIVFENGNPTEIELSRDKMARRVIAATTGENKLVFIVIYNPESVFDGPLLAELPQVVSEISEKNKLNIADAINLDGGSASTFISNSVTLTEISPVGSFFCLK